MAQEMADIIIDFPQELLEAIIAKNPTTALVLLQERMCFIKMKENRLAKNISQSPILNFIIDLETVFSNYNGKRFLHLAVEAGLKDVAEALLKQGAKINEKDSAGYTPLHIAADQGNLEMVKLLVENNAYIEATTKALETPLILAAAANDSKFNPAVIQYLVDKNANVNAESKDGQTPLYHASSKDNVNIVKLLAQNTIGINELDKEDGMNPLSCALVNLCFDNVQYLVNRGADLEIAILKTNLKYDDFIDGVIEGHIEEILEIFSYLIEAAEKKNLGVVLDKLRDLYNDFLKDLEENQTEQRAVQESSTPMSITPAIPRKPYPDAPHAQFFDQNPVGKTSFFDFDHGNIPNTPYNPSSYFSPTGQ